MSTSSLPDNSALRATESLRASLAKAPDLDWSQVRETVLMLELAAGQVKAAMQDSNTSVDILAQTFTTMADMLATVDAAIGTLPDTVGNGLVKDEIRNGTQQIHQKIHHAIIAFQFYDKLVQRLAHVCHSLEGLSDLVNDRTRLYTPQSWVDLQTKIRSQYTMQEECAMFDAVIAGLPVQEALNTYMSTRLQEMQDNSGDVELF